MALADSCQLSVFDGGDDDSDDDELSEEPQPIDYKSGAVKAILALLRYKDIPDESVLLFVPIVEIDPNELMSIPKQSRRKKAEQLAIDRRLSNAHQLMRDIAATYAIALEIHHYRKVVGKRKVDAVQLTLKYSPRLKDMDISKL